MNTTKKRYDTPAVLGHGTVERETHNQLVSSVETDMTGRYPAGTIGFGI
jgi:hypothetical protein